VRAGAQILVAGTSIFHTADPAAAVHSLRQAATEALAQPVRAERGASPERAGRGASKV